MAKTLTKILGAGLGLALPFLSGCQSQEPQTMYLEGEVIDEAGNVAGIIESGGAIFGNESVKLGGSTYLIEVKTPEGIYTIDVFSRGDKSIEAMALRIKKREEEKPGTRVKFGIRRIDRCGNDVTYFGKDKIGYLGTDMIEVLD